MYSALGVVQCLWQCVYAVEQVYMTRYYEGEIWKGGLSYEVHRLPCFFCYKYHQEPRKSQLGWRELQC